MVKVSLKIYLVDFEENYTAHIWRGRCTTLLQQAMASEFGKLQSLSSPMTQRKRLSQISGLLTTSIDNTPIADPLPNDQDDTTGIELFYDKLFFYERI